MGLMMLGKQNYTQQNHYCLTLARKLLSSYTRDRQSKVASRSGLLSL